jgi:multisubunit Na+/H+ antiporter MnhB subunit
MNNSYEYLQGMFISRTIAGFVILGTGITVLLKAVWMTSPIGTMTWGIILSVGMLLILLAVIAISYRR